MKRIFSRKASRKKATPETNDEAGQSLVMPSAPKGTYDDAEVSGSPTDGAPNPYIVHQEEDAGEENGGASSSGSDEEDDVLTGNQTLVTIPGAIVHLIDNEESVHLATGDFSLVRLYQEKVEVAIIAKIGDDLKWPILKDEPAVKLDDSHYFFTIKVPKSIADEKKKSSGEITLNYGLTFAAGSEEERSGEIQEVDRILEEYSLFSKPKIYKADGEAGSGEGLELDKLPEEGLNVDGKVVPADKVREEDKTVAAEETSAAFWTTLAPNVDDYNSKAAKGIATGAGHIIRGIFWLSDSTVAQMDTGHLYMKSKFKAKEKKTKISPITMASVRSARKLSGMTDKVAAGVLGGVLYTTGLLTGAVINSTPGKKVFKLMPGEVALVSLDAFGKVFDALEKAGRDVATHSSSVTQDFVDHRYGDSARELTDEGFQTVGNFASVAWTITKIRKALNPNKGLKVSKRGIAKSLAKSAMGTKKA